MDFTRPVSRRSFLKTGLKIGAAAALTPSLFRLMKPPVLSAEDLKAGLAEYKLPKEVLERLIKSSLERGGDYADVYLLYEASMNLFLEEERIKSGEYGINAGAGIRVIEEDRIGFGHSSVFEEKELVKAAGTAALIASSGPAMPPRSLVKNSTPSYINVMVPLEEVTLSKKAEMLKKIDKAARKYDSRIKQVSITYHEGFTHRTMANSQGILIEDSMPMSMLRVNTIARDGKATAPGFLRMSSRKGWEQYTEADAGELGRKAAEQAVTMLKAREAPMGTMTVVIGNSGGVLFHEAVGHGLEADAIRKKASFYVDKKGEKVAADIVNLVDDATLPNLRGTFNVDDEAVPGQRKTLIEKGILKSYMFDQFEAFQAHTLSTGNGRRDNYSDQPMPRMSNTFILPGEDDPEEIIKDTKKGIYAKNFGGGMVDTSSGNFTFNTTEAYLIEDGKITAPVKGASLVGNGPDILKKIDRLGNDLDFWPGTCGKGGQWVPVTSGAPTLRIREINVGGSG